jgi:molecular chaperone IbpA
MPKGSTQNKLAFKKGATIMTNLTRYNAADLSTLMDRITRNSIGMDEYFDRLFNLHETTTNYPPYNLVQINNVESHLELALAGFRKEEVNVYTEYGKLFVEGQKADGRLSTREWLAEVLNERGLYPTTQKSGRLYSKTDFYGSYLGK